MEEHFLARPSTSKVGTERHLLKSINVGLYFFYDILLFVKTETFSQARPVLAEVGVCSLGKHHCTHITLHTLHALYTLHSAPSTQDMCTVLTMLSAHIRQLQIRVSLRASLCTSQCKKDFTI